MSSNSPDPNNPRAGGWLARLKGMMPSLRAGDEPAPEEAQPAWGVQATPAPTPAGAANPPQALPVAVPATPEVPLATPVEASPAAVPVAAPVHVAEATAEMPPLAAPVAEPPAEEPVANDGLAVAEPAPTPTTAPAIRCPVCEAVHDSLDPHCADCGYYFSPADLTGVPATAATAVPAARIQGRYELAEMVSEREGVRRYRAFDHGAGGTLVPVVVVEQQAPAEDVPPAAEPVAEAPPEDDDDALDEILPSFDMPTAPVASPITEVLPARPAWPSVGWESNLLRTLEHAGLPHIVASFTENGRNYLVEEVPQGRVLWDAWDDPQATAAQRFNWLAETAEALQALHHNGAMLEGIRPEVVVVGDDGRARLSDLSDLLPLPLSAGTPIRGLLYTAPEVMAGNGKADARADLYSFGAMLYALHLGRELNDKVDFDGPGNPKPFIPRFPDVHPAFGRLMMKTFRREVENRLPTDEAGREDPTGFTELVRVLRATGRVLDQVRLEVASWTTTGIVRTGNEDAFALLHAAESRQEDMTDHVLVLLCDGMGGYEAGEIAAALTIQALRTNLVQQKPFATLAGAGSFATDALNSGSRPEGHLAPPPNVDELKQLIKAALKDANKQVFTASRAPGSKRRGMGCTAEVVYVDNRNVVVGHVGDSRAYHLSEGQLVQLTRDQTLVNRLVELGTLSPEEAETHPRRNELQQAVGGQPDVEPGLYHAVLKPGDWVVVCSDGVTNHVTNLDLKQMLLGEGYSAETVARRLVNLTNINGATDNATVVVIRATPLS